MKLDLKEDMYFRTKSGTINKIDSLTDDKSEFYFDTKPIFSDGECLGSKWGYTKDIIKASDKPIDILNTGDFLDNHCIIRIENNTCYTNDGWFINGDDIEDLVTFICTKESFEQMSYKVGD